MLEELRSKIAGEEFDYPAAAAIATSMLILAFVMLLIINGIQAWHLRYVGNGDRA